MNVRCALCWMAVLCAALPCLGQAPDWWQSERDLAAWLWVSNTPIARLVARVATPPVTDGQAAMFKIAVCLRAGMDPAAAQTVPALRRVCSKLDPYQISSIYYAACEEEAWQLARAVVEAYDEDISELTLENRLLKHWLESGWTLDQVEAWFAERPAAVQPFWLKEHLRFAQNHGRGDALLRRMADRVRQNPSDSTNAIVFLDALLYARTAGPVPDLAWFVTSVKPVRALEAKALAERFQQLEHWQTALQYYEAALTMPLTDAELEPLGRMRQVFISVEKLRAEVAITARESMAVCLLKLGQADVAQMRMVEAAHLRKKHDLPPNAILAGEVQAASGERTIERRMADAAQESEDDAAYWRQRAHYYRGRGEQDLEESALKKALSLTQPQTSPAPPGKGFSDLRSAVLAEYAQFLARQRRQRESVALLRQELAQVPPLAESAKRAAHLLAFEYSEWVQAKDEVLWKWLGNRPVWESTEERLLWRMLEAAASPSGAAPAATLPPAGRPGEKVPSAELERHFRRAEELVLGGHPSRAYTLGWVMNRLQFPKRAVPLLKQAVAAAANDEAKQSATIALWESLLDTGAWQEAESLFPQVTTQLSLRVIPEWYSRLALAAAGDGHNADALRLWSRLANASPITLRGLEQLASHGLRDELIAFYEAMQKELPASYAPARAIQRLKQ